MPLPTGFLFYGLFQPQANTKNKEPIAIVTCLFGREEEGTGEEEGQRECSVIPQMPATAWLGNGGNRKSLGLHTRRRISSLQPSPGAPKIHISKKLESGAEAQNQMQVLQCGVKATAPQQKSFQLFL